jgi:hypothetical protein
MASVVRMEVELAGRGIDPALLDTPWRAGYPG